MAFSFSFFGLFTLFGFLAFAGAGLALSLAPDAGGVVVVPCAKTGLKRAHVISRAAILFMFDLHGHLAWDQMAAWLCMIAANPILDWLTLASGGKTGG